MIRTKTPDYDDGFSHNPDSLSRIYTTAVMDTQYWISSDNWRKKDEVKINAVQVNAVKILSASPSKGYSLRRSFLQYQTSGVTLIPHKILLTLSSKLYSTYNLKALKETLFHLGGNISDFPNLNNCTFIVIFHRYGVIVSQSTKQ